MIEPAVMDRQYPKRKRSEIRYFESDHEGDETYDSDEDVVPMKPAKVYRQQCLL